MKIDVHVSKDARQFQRLEFLAGEVSDYSVRTFGTFFARLLAATTPPNRWWRSPKVLRSQKNEDIKILRERISWNISGQTNPAEIEGFAQPVPYRNLPGQWLALDPQTRKPVKPRGFFGIVVPISWKKVRGQKIPETSPEQAYAGGRWDGKKVIGLQRKKIKFVRKNALKAFVKKRQKDAGRLISGWAPGARVFAIGANIEPGFFESLRGKGFGRMFKDKKGLARGVLVNKQAYNPEQASFLRINMSKLVRRAEDSQAAQVQRIKNWYAQQAQKILSGK